MGGLGKSNVTENDIPGVGPHTPGWPASEKSRHGDGSDGTDKDADRNEDDCTGGNPLAIPGHLRLCLCLSASCSVLCDTLLDRFLCNCGDPSKKPLAVVVEHLLI